MFERPTCPTPGASAGARRLGSILTVLTAILPAILGPAAAASGEPTESDSKDLSSPEAETEPALRAALYQRMASVDPHRVTGFIPFSALLHFYEGLVGLDEESRVVPKLAERWEKVGTSTWRFHLRPGVMFHDGRPLTAEDVVYSLQRVRAPGSEFQNRLRDVVSVSAPGPLQVDLEVEGPSSLFLTGLTSVVVVPTDAPERIETPIGTGPYRWAGSEGTAESRWDRVELEAFSDHWSAAPRPSRVIFFFEPDNDKRIDMLLKGQVDWVGAPRADSHAAIEAHPDLWLESRPAAKIVALEPRVDRGIFSDARVRNALDLALDREALAADVFGRLAKPAGQLTTPTVLGYVPEIEAPTRDLAAARRLLHEAGLPVGTAIELHAPEAQEKTAAELRRQLAEAGIDLQIRLHPNRDYYRIVRRSKPELFLSIFTNSMQDAGWVFGVKLRTPGRSGLGETNRNGFSDPQIDAWSDRAMELEAESTERLLLLRRIAERARELRPIVPLVWTMNVYGIRRDLDWHPRADGRFFAWEVGLPGAVISAAADAAAEVSPDP